MNKQEYQRNLISRIQAAAAHIGNVGKSGLANHIIVNSAYGSMFNQWTKEQERLEKIQARRGKIDNLLASES